MRIIKNILGLVAGALVIGAIGCDKKDSGGSGNPEKGSGTKTSLKQQETLTVQWLAQSGTKLSRPASGSGAKTNAPPSGAGSKTNKPVGGSGLKSA